MRPVLLWLAIGFSFVSAPTFAWTPSAEQKAEIHCVYNTLSPEERAELTTDMLGTEAEAAAVHTRVETSMQAAVGECSLQYGWDYARGLAGVEYAMAATTMTAGTANLPASLTPDMLKGIFGQFDEELAYGFSFAAQGEMDQPTFDAWNAKAEQALIQGGVPQADLDPAFLYLGGIADLAMVSFTWEDLFASGAR